MKQTAGISLPILFKRVILALFVLALAVPAPASEKLPGEVISAAYPDGTARLEGVIVKVVSAGELALWQKGRVIPFRLHGIFFPPADSPAGRQAKKKVSDMTFSTLLELYLLPEDPVEEPLPENNSESRLPQGVVVIRGRCLNGELVRLGMARVAESCRIPGLCADWKAAEAKAGAAGNALPPSGN